MGAKRDVPRFDALVMIWFATLATVLTAYALSLGYDGVLLTTVIGGLMGVGGFSIGKVYKPVLPPSL